MTKPDQTQAASADTIVVNPTADGAKNTPRPEQTHFSVSSGFAQRLAKMQASLSFTSYQSNQLYFVGLKSDGGVNIHQTMIRKPMGLSYDSNQTLTLSSAYQIMRFENVLEPQERVNQVFDTCFVPRLVHVTGNLDAHDVGVDTHGSAIFVNTRFNCLARPSTRHSFEEIWRPHFISALVNEDRCHLNGLAMEDGAPKYVTAISRSDTIDGWRDRRADGGVVIDVAQNKVVCEGLSMPHSPRMYKGDLWVLNSGTGELGVVAFNTAGQGSFEPRVFCPGFLRGLSFHGNLAIVGLSKPRYQRFEGLELDAKLQATDSEPWCGLQIIDLDTGTCVDWLRIDGAVAELYDLEVLPEKICPMAIAPESPEIINLITHAK